MDAANIEVQLAQGDGGPPQTLVAGSAPGESGVSIVVARFLGGVHVNATARQHLIFFNMSRTVRLECRTVGRTLLHEAPCGSLAILPAGIESSADANESCDTLVVSVEPAKLALAAAEDSALEAKLIQRLSGRDQPLLDLARTLVRESWRCYPNGPLAWNEVASSFIDNLVARHTSGFDGRSRGTLGSDVLAKLREHVIAHLEEPIEVATLAGIAGRSPFHFSRVFKRSVGMTPYRYIVHLRLQRAVELVREGRAGLAEIAASTGFADQSHLSRWIRRVHGVAPTQIAN
jgi:AraC family transcriptional regulator